MPRKKLVNIGEAPQMPTIAEFLTEMAERQRDEIRRLKDEAEQRAAKAESEEIAEPVPGALSITVPEPTGDEPEHTVVPDAFVLHPVRIVRKPRKSSRTRAAAPRKTSKKSASTRKKSAKTAKKTVKAKKSATKRARSTGNSAKTTAKSRKTAAKRRSTPTPVKRGKTSLKSAASRSKRK